MPSVCFTGAATLNGVKYTREQLGTLVPLAGWNHDRKVTRYTDYLFAAEDIRAGNRRTSKARDADYSGRTEMRAYENFFEQMRTHVPWSAVMDRVQTNSPLRGDQLVPWGNYRPMFPHEIMEENTVAMRSNKRDIVSLMKWFRAKNIMPVLMRSIHADIWVFLKDGLWTDPNPGVSVIWSRALTNYRLRNAKDDVEDCLEAHNVTERWFAKLQGQTPEAIERRRIQEEAEARMRQLEEDNRIRREQEQRDQLRREAEAAEAARVKAAQDEADRQKAIGAYWEGLMVTKPGTRKRKLEW